MKYQNLSKMKSKVTVSQKLIEIFMRLTFKMICHNEIQCRNA